MGDFRMPSLGADMTEGTLVEWLVQPGQTVHHGDIVAAVDTSKSVIEIEVFEDGVVDELLVPLGSTVPVGAALARLTPIAPAPAQIAPPREVTEPPPMPAPRSGPKSAASPLIRRLAHELGVDLQDVTGTGQQGKITRTDVRAAARPTSRSVAAGPIVPPQPAGGTPAVEAGRSAVSPYARRRAAELGVDLSGVHGSGSRGAIVARDVERAAAVRDVPAAEPTSARGPQAAGDRSAAMREAIAALMARSKREIPHYYLQTTIDLSRSLDWLRACNDGRPVAERLLPVALLLKAASLAVQRVPEVNGFYLDGRFSRSTRVHLGVAVSLRGGGLIAPALHDAHTLTTEELMAALKDLVSRARAGRLRASEMSDSTITVTNLGEQGVEAVHGVIYPPQVALLGLGRVVERPWAVGGLLGIRPLLTATLAADHRVSDGHRGGLYLRSVDELLQTPEEL